MGTVAVHCCVVVAGSCSAPRLLVFLSRHTLNVHGLCGDLTPVLSKENDVLVLNNRVCNSGVCEARYNNLFLTILSSFSFFIENMIDIIMTRKHRLQLATRLVGGKAFTLGGCGCGCGCGGICCGCGGKKLSHTSVRDGRQKPAVTTTSTTTNNSSSSISTITISTSHWQSHFRGILPGQVHKVTCAS
jgi:hypothetical protein